MNNIINNIDISMLPDNVVEAMLNVFKTKSLDKQMIILSRLTHGVLFKCERVDLFNMNYQSASKIYNDFIQEIKLNLEKSI